MGRHVAVATEDTQAAPWFLNASREARAWREGVRKPQGLGRHAAPVGVCAAYVLVAGAHQACVVPLAEHEGRKHEHPLYGVWDNAVYDLDKYRKRFVR